jgi:hypothetical protein
MKEGIMLGLAAVSLFPVVQVIYVDVVAVTVQATLSISTETTALFVPNPEPVI